MYVYSLNILLRIFNNCTNRLWKIYLKIYSPFKSIANNNELKIFLKMFIVPQKNIEKIQNWGLNNTCKKSLIYFYDYDSNIILKNILENLKRTRILLEFSRQISKTVLKKSSLSLGKKVVFFNAFSHNISLKITDCGFNRPPNNFSKIPPLWFRWYPKNVHKKAWAPHSELFHKKSLTMVMRN